MKKEIGKTFCYGIMIIVTAVSWFLIAQGPHAVVSFMQKVEKKTHQEKTSTSTEYRYDKEFQRTLNKFGEFCSVYQEEFSTAVPGLASTEIMGNLCEQMVPQGICVAGDYMLVSAYDNMASFAQKTKQERYEVNPSVLYVLSNQNPKERKLLTTIVLPDANHVGGVAFDGERLWIAKSTDRQCSIIDYKVIQRAAQSGATSYLLPEYSQNVDCGAVASFLTFHDGRIWIGTYTNQASGMGMLRSYDIVKQRWEEEDEKPEHPYKLILAKREEIQIPGFANGVTFMDNEDETYMALTTSRGRYFDSKVYFYRVAKEKQTGKHLFYCYDSSKFPPMAEELVCDGRITYFLFESSATCYSTLAYQKCAYPVDRICATATTELFLQNHGPAYDNITAGWKMLRLVHYDWLDRREERSWEKI